METRQVTIFGCAATHARYEALYEVLRKALTQHKLTGTQIGFTVKGSRHPESITNRLPPSEGKLADRDSIDFNEQVKTVLMDERIQTEFGVYDLVYNFDEDILPRVDFYIVPVPVGRPVVDIVTLI